MLPTNKAAERKLAKLAEVSQTRERHRQMARTAAVKEKELVLDLAENHPEVTIAEICEISGRSRQTIFNWRKLYPSSPVSGD